MPSDDKLVALAEAWLEYDQGRLTADELAALIPDALTDALDSTAAYLRGLTPDQRLTIESGWPDDSAEYGMEMMKTSEFKAKYNMTPGSWVFEPLLPRGEVAALVGSAGEGKTFIALGAAIAATQGMDYGPFKTNGNKRTVLYITEESLGEVSTRIQNYQDRWGISDADLDGGLYMWPMIHQLLARKGNGKETTVTAKEIYLMVKVAQMKGELPQKIDLVVLDYFRRSIIEANENDNGDIARAMRGVNTLGVALDCGMLVVHHKGKNKDGGPRGASTFGDFAYCVMVTSGGNLKLVNRTTAGDLIFVDAEKETNLLSANVDGAKQIKGGKMDDYRFCLVAQDHYTVTFLDSLQVDQYGLNDEYSKLTQQLMNKLKANVNQWIARQDIVSEFGCDPGNLTRAWKELYIEDEYEQDKQGRNVFYRFTGVPL